MEQKNNVVPRCKVSKKKYVNIILTLLAVMIMPIYLYGTRVLLIASVSLFTALVADFICLRISGKKVWEKWDLSFVITALICTMLLPATVPLWVASVSVCIAIVIAKYPFGGQGYNIFNPSAVGIAFVSICWPEYALRYPVPFTSYGAPELIQFGNSPASVLHVGGTPKIDAIDVFLGKFPGPMGTTCMLVLAAVLLYLLLRKVVSLRVILSALFVVGLFAVLFPRVLTGRWNSLLYEGCSGGLIFGLIYMASDPVTIPKTKSGQILFGFVLGTIIMLFRRFGTMELEFVYAILLSNIFAIPCDKYAYFIKSKLDKLLPDEKYGKKDTSKKAEKEFVEIKVGEKNA